MDNNIGRAQEEEEIDLKRGYFAAGVRETGEG